MAGVAFQFEIMGRPTAWQRTNDVKGRKVTPKDMRDAQARIRGHAREAARVQGIKFPLAGALKLEVLCIYEIPEGFRGAKRDAALAGLIYRPSVPDCDNLGKQVSDALNPEKAARRLADALIGSAYRDDAQICDFRVLKRYGHPERTVVRLTVLPAWDEAADRLL
jgi:Holliday junction resolvase RusA-like endonuclease